MGYRLQAYLALC